MICLPRRNERAWDCVSRQSLASLAEPNFLREAQEITPSPDTVEIDAAEIID
jgi:hypothetical protein